MTEPAAFISYSRADSDFALRISRDLKAAGAHVWLDQLDIHAGREWDNAVETALAEARSMLLILSPSSAGSRNVRNEIAFALDEGKTIIPILYRDCAVPLQLRRIQHIDFRTDYGQAFVDLLRHMGVQNDGEDRTAPVESDVRDIEEKPTEIPPQVSEEPRAAAARIDQPGGTIPAKSKFYIVRPTDEELADALIRKDALITIQGGRQMGKTSLIARSLEYARASGATTAFTDLQRMNQSDLENIERFYVALGNMLADQLGIDADIEDKWRPTRSPNVNFENFISREVMPRANGHLFWAIDEADRVAATDFASDFFGMIRSWHSCRVVNPDSPLANLTTITAYTVESHRLITDQQQSGFNVGTRLVLHDFKIEEVEALNKLYGSPLRSGEEISRYFNLLAGQPYLVQRGLFELSAGGSSFEEFALNADCDEGPFGDHLGRMLWMMRQDPEMTEATRILLDGGSNISIKGFQGLRAAGIVVGPSSFDSRFHCALYAGYLRKHLGEQTG